MADAIIKSAIQNLEQKYMPSIGSPQIFVPSEQYRSIFPQLEVWGKDTEDVSVLEKVKYIYDQLLAIHKDKPNEVLVSLLVDLGATKFGESKVDKVYKYFHLSKEAEKATKYRDLLLDELNGMKVKKEEPKCQAETEKSTDKQEQV